MRTPIWLIIAAALSLSACTTTRTGPNTDATGTNAGGYLNGDGPGVIDTARLAAAPDAVPRAEPLHKYANRPYDALGTRYVPLTTPGIYRERGIASWYGKKFQGQPTANGEPYDMYAMTAAHKTLPVPSYARVTNLANGKSVIVRVNDRGPFVRGRIIDLSYAAAYRLDFISAGSAEVEVESLNADQFDSQLIAPPSSATTTPIYTAPVQAEVIPVDPMPIVQQSAAASPERQSGIYLQLGSFRSRSGAESFLAHMRDVLGDTDKQIVLNDSGGLSRVQLGPYRTPDEARAAAKRLEPRLGFKPFVSK
jgi:rare lipoprotein A